MRSYLASIALIAFAVTGLFACNRSNPPASPSSATSSVDDLSFDETGALPEGIVRILGSVRGVRGTCPELALAVRGADGSEWTIRTARVTKFEGTPCSGLKADTRIGVLGRKAGTNAVQALRVLSPLSR